jgi:hypothetical protein
MPKKWFKYHVTEVVADMLRYDHGWIPVKPPTDKRYSVPLAQALEKMPSEVFSPSSPCVLRWNSYGIHVTNIERVDKPTMPMWIWTYTRHSIGGWINQSLKAWQYAVPTDTVPQTEDLLVGP